MQNHHRCLAPDDPDSSRKDGGVAEGLSPAASFVGTALALFISRVERGDFEIPLMPETVRRAMAVSQDPTASFEVLASVARSDPSFAVQTLRLANSALFGSLEPVESLSAALSRVGPGGLRELLTTASTGEILVLPGDPGLSTRLQRRALAVAVCADLLAEEGGLDREEAFTAGIVHDVGLPLAFGLIHSLRKELPPRLGESPELQRALAERLHTRLGQELGKIWGLPDSLVTVLAFHHDPGAAPTDSALVHCVFAARTLADVLSFEPEGQPLPEDCPGLRALEIDPARAEMLAVQAALRLV